MPDSTLGDPAPEPPKPPPIPWRTIARVVGVLVVAYGTLAGFVADTMSLFTGLPVAANVAILSAAVGFGWLIGVHQKGRINDLVDRRQNSAQIWRDRLISGGSFLLALILMALVLVPVGGADPVSTQSPATPSPVPAPMQPAATGGCSEPVTERLVQMSHHAFATAPGQDRGIDLEPGGYVQQRFFAATSQIASVAVITSRPGTEGPFDPNRIGQLRLTLYRADEQANNVAALPLQALESDKPPTTDGIVIDAGRNHEQSVFRFCPVRVEPGQRYAFRVTNETPNVVLAFSLNTKPGPRTSIDIIGEIHGEDRLRINYFQVAGYVCSLASC